jgi:hypothetical protein
VNKKTYKLFLEIVSIVAIALSAISLTLLFIYYNQPNFICELCQQNCSLADIYGFVE